MWSGAGLLRFVNLVKREEIPNIITKLSVDLVPLGDQFCKLLDTSCNETKYLQFLDQCWRQQIT